jgi:hypothetical protein
MRTLVAIAAGAIEFACLTVFLTALIVGLGLTMGYI